MSPTNPAGDTNFQGASPPHNLEAEKAVLGAVIMDNNAYTEVSDLVRADDFYHEAHKATYRGIQDLFRRGEPVDELTLSDWLKKDGSFEHMGGEVFLSELLRYVVSEKNVASYAGIVRRLAVTRRLITAGIQIASTGYGQPDMDEYIELAERSIFEIALDRPSQAFSKVDEVARDLMSSIEARNQSDEEFSGLPTGFSKLDEMTGGFQKSDLLIVAGRPAMGKTAFALNMAVNAARHLHSRGRTDAVAVFSLEMSRIQLVSRMIAVDAKLDVSRLRSTRSQPMTVEEWQRFTQAMGRLGGYPILMDDTAMITVESIKSKCRKLKMDQGLGLVVIDYLQLMDTARSRGGDSNRAIELGEISRGLKIMAKELDVPVVALSQLNRELEKRPDKTPRLSDLRESGAIEQDADIIMFIHREAGYHPNPQELPVETQRDAEVIVAKQRNGPTGKVKLYFISEFTSFENPQYGEEY